MARGAVGISSDTASTIPLRLRMLRAPPYPAARKAAWLLQFDIGPQDRRLNSNVPFFRDSRQAKVRCFAANVWNPPSYASVDAIRSGRLTEGVSHDGLLHVRGWARGRRPKAS